MHYLLIILFLLKFQNYNSCPQIDNYSLWKNIEYEEISIYWELPACENSIDCLGVETPYKFKNLFQQKPLHIQKETQLLFTSNSPKHEFYKVYTEEDFVICNFSSAVKINSNFVSLSNNFLEFGNNYFIAKGDEFYNICIFGFKLNVTLQSYDCLERNNTCNGNGKCVTLPWDNSYSCLCCSAYIGKYCEEKNGCNNIFCSNKGTCVDIPDKESLSYYFSCQCPIGFYGQICENQLASYCSINLCMNGGICFINSSSPLSYTCSCISPYHGKVCELLIDYCHLNPCQNNGVCLSLKMHPYYSCHCLDGYFGANCEINRQICNEIGCTKNEACTSNHCLNNSECESTQFGYKCICKAGIEGNECKIKINNCQNDTCLPTIQKINSEEGITNYEQLHSTYTIPNLNNETYMLNKNKISENYITLIIIVLIITTLLIIIFFSCVYWKKYFKKRVWNKINKDSRITLKISEENPIELFNDRDYPKKQICKL